MQELAISNSGHFLSLNGWNVKIQPENSKESFRWYSVLRHQHSGIKLEAFEYVMKGNSWENGGGGEHLDSENIFDKIKDLKIVAVFNRQI